jgi:hypothetical protein
MTNNTPTWTAFDDRSPPVLPDPEGAGGRIVALLIAKGAEDGAWGTEVAIGLVRGWVAGGLRVVLADAGLERPTLHDAFELKNQEGLADALLWGASVQHVARPLPEGGFYLITAGTAVPEGGLALRSARWYQLCDGFQEAGVSLVVLIPAGQSGHSAVLNAATDVVVLAAPGEEVHDLVGSWAPKLRAVVGNGASKRAEDAPAIPTRDPAQGEQDVTEPGLAASEPEPEVTEPGLAVSEPEPEVTGPELAVSEPEPEVTGPELAVSEPGPEVTEPELDATWPVGDPPVEGAVPLEVDDGGDEIG